MSPACSSASTASSAGSNINIAGRVPADESQIGYVVLDVETGDGEDPLDLKHKLDEVAGTIRTRILY